MRTSENTGELASAESAAQIELGTAVTDKKNPHFKSDYLSHKGAVEVALPIYAKHGMSITQSFRVDGEIMFLDTRITHKSGEWRESEYPVCSITERPQVKAACGTYAKRLSLVGLVCLAADADDDGNEANKTTIEAPKRERPSELSAEQSSEILEELLASLKKCVSHTALEEWGEANRGKTANLIKAHRVRIGEEYKKLENSISNVRKLNG